jgi:cytochrome b subunit of formate dehydrogenase
MGWVFQKASDINGYAYDSRLIGPIVWASVWLAVGFCAIHAIRRARANPMRKPPARYNLNQKLYHWANFLLLAGLAVSGGFLFFRRMPELPMVGERFGLTWLSLHEWMGLLFGLGVLAHALAAMTRGDKKSMEPRFQEFRDMATIWRNFMGWTRDYPAPGKYDALQKIYHHILSLLAMVFVGSGTLMWLSASRIYLSARGLIHFCRQVHDLSALCLVVMVVAHFYFSIIKVNRQNLRDMAGLSTDDLTTEAQRHGE